MIRAHWAIHSRQPEGKVLRHGLGGGAPQAAFGARMWLPKVRRHKCPLLRELFRTALNLEARTFYFASLVSFLLHFFTFAEDHAQKTTPISEVTGYECVRRCPWWPP